MNKQGGTGNVTITHSAQFVGSQATGKLLYNGQELLAALGVAIFRANKLVGGLVPQERLCQLSQIC
jgi:hypothetical protein